MGIDQYHGPQPPTRDVEALRLFRTARASRVLAGFGSVFRAQHEFDENAKGDFLARPDVEYGAVDAEATPRGGFAEDGGGCEEEGLTPATKRFYRVEAAADAFYECSEPNADADLFVSHAWSDSPVLKHLALLLHANLIRAVVASWAAWALVVLALLASRGFDVTAFGGAPWLPTVFSSVPPAVFYLTFFFGHVVAEACVRPRRWWVDKLCIHQRRSFLKVAGLRALPLFVRRSTRLCVLHSESYFSRLWTSYEVATFLAEHSADRVDVVPLWLAPWILGVITIDIVAAQLAIQLNLFITPIAVNAFGPVGGLVALMTFTDSLAYAPMVVPIVMAYRARRRAQEMMLAQLESFSLRETECSIPADREYVERHVASIYGGHCPIQKFEEAVRTDVRRLLEERGGVDARTPFLLAAIPFMPFAWNSAADILGCDGYSCAEAAASYGMTDLPFYVLTNATLWLSMFLLAPTVYPGILRLLRRTERIRSPRARLAASCGAVWVSYGLWGFASGVIGSLVFICMTTPGAVATAALVACLSGLVAWNVHLFS